MDLSAKATGMDAWSKMLYQLTVSESSKLLSRVGELLVTRERLFLRHLEDGQGEWAEPSPAYAERKRRQHGSREKWVRTGAAKQALTKPDDGPLLVRTLGRKRRLVVTLRRNVRGQNVYGIVQRGRFAGVEVSSAAGKRTLSADETIRRNAGLATGGRGLAKERTTRISKNPMPITVWRDGDENVVGRLIREEFAVTLKMRGLQP